MSPLSIGNLIGFVVGSTILLLLFIGAFVARYLEIKDWNNGICLKSGKPWKSFDTDSQGGRGYNDGEGNCTWISYPGVDRIRVKQAKLRK